MNLIKIALQKTGATIKRKEIPAKSHYVKLRKNTLII